MPTKNDKPLYIPYSGHALLETSLLNKGSAFSKSERANFNLSGLLPPLIETIEEQVDRAYAQFSKFNSSLDKHIYLRRIQDMNETLYYALIEQHLEEMMPVIYTPTVGEACEKFSDIYRCARGLFISYDQRHDMDDILRNAIKPNVKVIVVTDGERILGLGDQGMGGMGIPIGKLSLYTACGGISPAYTLPVMLDVGTNNQSLIDNPMYMGVKSPRIDGDEYFEFIDTFIQAVKRRWPNVLLQFEDFAQPKAMPLLERYRDELCCFNDDIQGTAAVTVGSLLAACRSKGVKLSEQVVTFVGAGSAGCGIAEQIIMQMKTEGISDEQARSQVFMVDRFGLVTDGMSDLRDFQQRLAANKATIEQWDVAGDYASLLEVMQHAKPSILIGVSGQPGLFTQQVIETMHQGCERPIIFPLSNPSKQVEATPQQVIEWTKGQAIVATGSPFEPVIYQEQSFVIPQCNNSYIFPGLGLGVLACGAKRISDEMLMASSLCLASVSPLANDGQGSLLPPLTEIANISKQMAFDVAKVAIEQGHALQISDEQLLKKIEKNFWNPQYRDYRRVSI
ncbi:NAD-dependent malic enzyme [Psychrobium sp. 1_MG-2023]|uniref:NAD-dependent malic enzyme n=1 Tax=Psychrobium sp. 1_MG-2023 TaxID=3062624 RepID=UPI000C33BD46|nr:NAD-dependent malic enzyme [Psychrobium sp. 1_MG-2023]MDP2562484.1 NAD-dependent malic enzyme [Psychrobium sp. 1_MG-2023]PKF54319.1 NAD-dependent malic enzyme [Alteromonadales bacterium alter-6D02]